MRVVLDESRRQRSSAAVDHRRALGLDRVGRDGGDQVALDQHIRVLDPGLVHPVEDMDVCEQDRRWSVRLLCEGQRGGRRGEGKAGNRSSEFAHIHLPLTQPRGQGLNLQLE